MTRLMRTKLSSVVPLVVPTVVSTTRVTGTYCAVLYCSLWQIVLGCRKEFSIITIVGCHGFEIHSLDYLDYFSFPNTDYDHSAASVALAKLVSFA